MAGVEFWPGAECMRRRWVRQEEQALMLPVVRTVLAYEACLAYEKEEQDGLAMAVAVFVVVEALVSMRAILFFIAGRKRREKKKEGGKKRIKLLETTVNRNYSHFPQEIIKHTHAYRWVLRALQSQRVQ